MSTIELDTETATSTRRPSAALLVLAAVGLLLLGAVAGVLLRMPLENKPDDAEPSAVDIGFSQDMAAHHAQAVDMAGIALIASTDNEVRRLAYDILTTQQNQIGRMQAWLQLWGESNQNVDGYMSWMTDGSSGGHHGGATAGPAMTGPMQSMPGMASQEEMTALRQSTGPTLDTMFLQLMLRHHQGGVPMLDYAAGKATTTAVRTLADTMSKTQARESQLMTTMLAARGANPLAMN
ncbi:DUF305 domain-containing protein [Nocardia fluminea]|uniref:Uncharacterized protein (DUF305 family) n=1 Tax=Nocardia fluminea TaxID=134984 RepID=A0A2N3V7H7_9NOCA|nr:DUF305 domain-containing protein [Nocardia fluminea]PKV77577.1 uncharacterized protein (DUF305 family) [Nocardia fluminea]